VEKQKWVEHPGLGAGRRRPRASRSLSDTSFAQRAPHGTLHALGASPPTPTTPFAAAEPPPTDGRHPATPAPRPRPPCPKSKTMRLAVAALAALLALTAVTGVSAIADPEKTVFTSFTIPNDTSGKPVSADEGGADEGRARPGDGWEGGRGELPVGGSLLHRRLCPTQQQCDAFLARRTGSGPRQRTPLTSFGSQSSWPSRRGGGAMTEVVTATPPAAGRLWPSRRAGPRSSHTRAVAARCLLDLGAPGHAPALSPRRLLPRRWPARAPRHILGGGDK
jgi:hypothetical protein